LRSAFSTQEKASGNISQIRLGCPADREGSDIAAVGSRGADFLDSNGQVRKQVRFAITGNIPVAVARIDPTGAFGYLTRDESWAVPVTLFDKEGHLAWSSNAFWAAGVDDSVPGDVYGDGKLSVVVGFNGGGESLSWTGKARPRGRRKRVTFCTWRRWTQIGMGARKYSTAMLRVNCSCGTGPGMRLPDICRTSMFRILQSPVGASSRRISLFRSRSPAKAVATQH
jgi:hypothetical protein